jgi:hypothetical protein
MTNVPIKCKSREDRIGGEVHVTTEAEVRIMQPQDKLNPEPPEAGVDKEEFFPGVLEGGWPG